MVFNNGLVVLLCFILISVWLGTVSFFLLRMIRHYNTLTKDISDHGLKAILEQILKRQHGIVEKTSLLQKSLDEVIVKNKRNIQKIGLIRFNPFSDTGGSQSFTMALLDETDSGLVMTSLYARTGNRWYVKEVRSGKGLNMDLSKEELSAIRHVQEKKDGAYE